MLLQQADKYYILNNEYNQAELIELKTKAQPYQNDDEIEIIPDHELYRILNEDQVISLANSIQIQREIPIKYSYLGSGGNISEEFYNKAVEPGNICNAGDDTYLFNKMYNL